MLAWQTAKKSKRYGPSAWNTIPIMTTIVIAPAGIFRFSSASDLVKENAAVLPEETLNKPNYKCQSLRA
jgi:hypothetical protein